jgi:hypothetical protein
MAYIGETGFLGGWARIHELVGKSPLSIVVQAFGMALSANPMEVLVRESSGSAV